MAKFAKLYSAVSGWVANCSDALFAFMNIMACLVILLGWCHTVACVWYFVGTGAHGWVMLRGLSHREVVLRYLVSLNWVIGQLQGSTDVVGQDIVAVRALQNAFMLGSVLVLAYFSSQLTTAIIEAGERR